MSRHFTVIQLSDHFAYLLSVAALVSPPPEEGSCYQFIFPEGEWLDLPVDATGIEPWLPVRRLYYYTIGLLHPRHLHDVSISLLLPSV